MLAVGVDSADVRVCIRLRIRIAGGDPLLQAAVLPEGEDFRAMRPRDRGGPIGRTVVDDEYVALRQACSQFVQYARQVLLLVPGRNEDERVRRHRARA